MTHSVIFLPNVDWIVLLDKGAVKEQGTYNDLLARQESDFATFLQENVKGKLTSSSTMNLAASGRFVRTFFVCVL